MKLLGVLFAITGLLGTIVMFGAAGGCDMNTLSLGEATLKAGMGALCVMFSSSGHKAVKERIRKSQEVRYEYYF